MDETLASFMKQSTQPRGKEERRERTQVQARSTTTQSESQMGQRNNLCSFQRPHQSQEAHQGKGNLKKDLITWLHQ
jgi:hypothetical protein